MKKILLSLPLLFILSCTQNITYSEIELNSVSKNSSVKDEIIEMEEGDIVQYKGSVELNNGNFTNDVIWTSDNTNSVIVDYSGKITALKAGNATLSIISNQDRSKKAYLKVKVNPYVERKIEVNSGTEGKLPPDNNPKPVDLNTPKNEITPTPSTLPGKTDLPSSIVTGKVFDAHGLTIDNVIVNIVVLDKNVNWHSTPQKTVGGDFIFKDVPANTLVRIDVSKDGLVKASRTEVIKSGNYNSVNVYNFGGSDPQDAPFAIQDEPQITGLYINSKKVNQLNTDPLKLNPGNPPLTSDTPDITVTGNNSVYISMSFNKEIEPESLEDNFQLISQSFSNNDFYIINKYSSTSDLFFSWNSNKTSVSVSVPLKNPLSMNSIIYRLQFKDSFKDKTGSSSIKNKYIKLGNNFSDYLVFRVTK